MNKGKEKVIKPPVNTISSGKVFKPSKRFRNKIWFIGICIAIIVWTLVNLGYHGIGYLVVTDEGGTLADLLQYSWLVNVIVWGFNLSWLIPLLILTPVYVNRIEYSVITESGEAMPEIYVKKGLLNVTRKHVPFRTITNISSRAGALDRLFGIGTVEIQTAGFSGQKSRGGPEEKIEGVVFYEEVRDFVLAELRKFRAPYTTTTEVVHPTERVALQREDLDSEMLSLLREIRDILKRQKK